MSEKFRLNKFISDSGVCSRRQADKYIETGHVAVNGRKAQVGDMVSKHDKVLLNGQLIDAKEEDDFVLMVFNKPIGIVSTTEIGVRNSIIDYIGFHQRIFPVGRLDKDSQGLIFLTNNGDLVNKILRAGNQHEKEYIVTVDKLVSDDFIRRMANGVPILGEMTKKCKVSKESANVFKITLVQGLNRQIRRMCEYFGYEVVKLERVRIMNISLKGLPIGEWRLVSDEEMKQIMKAIANSSSEQKAPAKQKPTSDQKPASTRKFSVQHSATKTEKPKSEPRIGKSKQQTTTSTSAKRTFSSAKNNRPGTDSRQPKSAISRGGRSNSANSGKTRGKR